MIYPILKYGNPDLRKKSSAVPQDYPNLDQLIDDMYETMHKARGIGLSAIQIGIPIKLFVIEAHLPEKKFDFKEVFINPKITFKSNNLINYSEGCLSVPGLTGMITRPNEIRIEYYDRSWKLRKRKYSGFRARMIQHEYDHLEGILYPDLLPHMWKELLQPSLKEIEEGKIESQYLMK